MLGYLRQSVVRQGALRAVATGRSAGARNLARRTYATTSRAGPKGIWAEVLIIGAAAVVGSVALSQRVNLDAKPKGKSQAATTTPSGARLISYEELQKHTTRESCWILVQDQIYDVTNFLDTHPGGPAIILKNSGQDATKIYQSIHSAGFFETLLKPEQHLGVVDPTTLPKVEATLTEDELRVQEARKHVRDINLIINLDDIEEVAHQVLSKIGWSYYRSTADTGSAFDSNITAFSRYWFRPRVLRPVREIDTSTTILGIPSSLPIFVSPAAMAKLGHPLGEINITRGAYACGIIQGISSNASCTVDEIADARQGQQPLIFQLYVNKDHKITEDTLRKIDQLGFKAIMLTVDAPVLGKRELDMKARGLPVIRGNNNSGGEGTALRAGVANSLGGYFDANLNWEDLAWIRSITKLPIVIKGVQCVEDVELALQYGCAGVLLSNHGGRQLDYAPASIDILYELRQRRPDILDEKKLEVYCDGGFRRGTDVLKALCLGATAVGLGRPFLFANGAYGEEGVIKVAEVIGEEIATSMRLLGVTKLSELKPEMVTRMA
ncbi:L-mandelate dehydrogenase [Calocera viscosa TUFC12733]|uniref:L-lactate dehydrogenase (cytochrome) n=1 Tax=Calocera viscosa (strain TUFC12733) TaxID=1330018 RepID=A0A167QLA9_CALVF|nr:L-mandelate dehydrogenase [Calocera viscosa TUFC12733]